MKPESEVINRKIKVYSRNQSFVDFLAFLFFSIGVAIIATAIALFLLKSPAYALLGILPLLFYRPKTFSERAKELDYKIQANGELVSSIQIARIPEDNREGYSKELISAFLKSTEEKFRNIDPAKFVSKEHLKHSASFLIVALLISLLFPAFFPGRFWFALHRDIGYIVKPESGRFNRGERIDIGIELFGPYIPGNVKLVYDTENNTKTAMLSVMNGYATKNLELRQSMNFYFEFCNIRTKTYRITIIEPVFIEELFFTLHYPGYLHLNSETKTERQLIVPAGTEVEVQGSASQILKEAFLVFNDTAYFDCDNKRFSGRFRINASGIAYLYVSGESSHKEPITIYAVPDLAPLVEIFYPGYNVNLPPDMKMTLGIKCSDDYALSKLELKYEFQKTGSFTLNLKKGSAEDTVFYEWNLNNLRILPGDRITYYAEVQDNAGQKSRSKTYYIIFPTMEQIYEEVAGKESMVQSDLKELEKIHEQGMNEISRIEEKLKRERQLSWLDSEKLKEAISKE